MASILSKASMPFMSIIVLLAGTILLVTVFIAPYWFARQEKPTYVGLWRFSECGRQSDKYECWRWEIPNHFREWLNVCRALMTISLILSTITLVSIPAYLYAGHGESYRCMMATFATSTFVAGICAIVGGLVFALKAIDEEWDVAWGLIVCVVSGSIIIVASIILIASAMSRKPKFDKWKKMPDLYIDPHKPTVYRIESTSPPQSPSADYAMGYTNQDFFKDHHNNY